MNNLDQIEATAKRSKALREAATESGNFAELYNHAHNAALDEVCLSLVKEVRELRAAASVFMRHATRPGDDGRFDDAYDAAKSKLQQLLENPDV